MTTASGDHGSVLRGHGYHTLRVARVVPETHDAASFVLGVPPELHELFRYTPGQFCTFRVHIDGDAHLRSYSMSSAPETDADLTVTVKRVDGGLVSTWILDAVSEGDELEVTRPAGVFCPQAGERPVLAFCGGSGITPVLSITKHVLAATTRSLKLLYANRDRTSVIFDDLLTELSAHHRDRLDVRRHFDSEGGFLTSDDIGGFVAQTLDADFYICGPGPFMDLVESTLHRIGVARERIFIERFLVERQEKEAALAAPAAAARGADGAAIPKEVTVTLGGRTEVIAYHPGDTVLETARRGGLRPPFSCESGNCATCMAFLKEGSVDMRANNALSPEEVEEGWILTCQGVPKGDPVIIEYEDL